MQAAASAGGSWGRLSGSFSYSRSELEKFDTNSTTIFASSSVVNGLEYFDSGELEAEATKVAKTDPAEFYARFGDYYIQGLIRGGYYMAIVNVFAESRDIQKKISAKIRASFDGFGSGKGSFDETINTYSRYATIDIKFIQRGGTGNQHVNLGADFDDLFTKINNFPAVVGKNPVTITALASSFTSLDNFPSSRDLDEIQRQQQLQKDALDDYAGQRAKVVTARNDWRVVRDNPKWFDEVPTDASQTREEKVGSILQDLANRQGALEDHMRNCIASSEQCLPIDFQEPIAAPPKRRKNILSPGVSEILGSRWLEKELDWKGTWTREGDSDIFRAHWRREDGLEASAMLKIRVEGNAVYVEREESNGTGCRYLGFLEAGNRKVVGHYTCDWTGDIRHRWEAEIIR